MRPARERLETELLAEIADEVGADVATAVDRNGRLTTALAANDVTTLATALDDLDAGRLQSVDPGPFISGNDGTKMASDQTSNAVQDTLGTHRLSSPGG